MSDKKLGRGLDYLLSLSKEATTEDKRVENIRLTDIRKNRFQPRETFDESSLQDLIDSIRENGVLQPILVKKEGLSYELIAGERRFKACMALGKETVPSIVIDVPENKMLQLALIENIQRENLNPIEEARAYQAMLKLESISHEDLSRRLGKKRPTITNSLRLLDLPREIQDHVSRGTISQGHARALLAFKTPADMTRVLKEILTKGLSVRDVENLYKKALATQPEENHKKTDSHQDNNILSYQEALKSRLGSKVNIRSRKGKGTIEISFYSDEDFIRLYNLLTSLD